MADEESEIGRAVRDITYNLGGFFRHLFPGVIVVGAAFAANPSWFSDVNPGDPWHLVLLFVVSTVVGNSWFVFNRYGLHQLIDWILYRRRSLGPPMPADLSKGVNYFDVLAQYIYSSSQIPPALKELRRHVGFRASAVLLMYTVGEVAILFAAVNEPGTFFSRFPWLVALLGTAAIAVGFWQNIITRHIDWYTVTPSG